MKHASVLDERSWNLLVQRLHDLGYTPVCERPTAHRGDTWLAVSDMLEDAGLLDAVISQYCRTKMTTRKPLAASMIGKAVLGWMTTTTVVSWSLFATIPYLDPANLAVRMVGGVPVEMTVVRPRYLIGDESLRGIGPDTVADCVMRWSATIIEALHLRSRAGTRTLWGTVALQSRAPFLPLTALQGDQASINRDLLSNHLPELEKLIECAPVDLGSGAGEMVTLRRTCCLRYTLPAGQYCASCSLVDRDSRVQRLNTDWIQRRQMIGQGQEHPGLEWSTKDGRRI